MTTELYSPEEHLLLQAWFDDSGITSEIDRLLIERGFVHDCNPYTRLDAAVGAIALVAIQMQSPSRGPRRPGEPEIRDRREEPTSKPQRSQSHQHLFTADWSAGTNGPSWQTTYLLCWLPEFERYIVACAMHSSAPFGYRSFALGKFGPLVGRQEALKTVLIADWRAHATVCDRGPWTRIVSSGLVPEVEALSWREEAWRRRTARLVTSQSPFREKLSEPIPAKPPNDPLFRRVFVVGICRPSTSLPSEVTDTPPDVG